MHWDYLLQEFQPLGFCALLLEVLVLAGLLELLQLDALGGSVVAYCFEEV